MNLFTRYLLPRCDYHVCAFSALMIAYLIEEKKKVYYEGQGQGKQLEVVKVSC